jgi:hypothetical protein
MPVLLEMWNLAQVPRQLSILVETPQHHHQPEMVTSSMVIGIAVEMESVVVRNRDRERDRERERDQPRCTMRIPYAVVSRYC